ncbi:MAG: Cys-tRNA(Pro) deacylase [Lachnospiraceae bacterium]|nr:Cys-tRNA(Pro) deacylase [Lachnospiraceae bacterium]MBP3351308.1 Cys-tRNA(Pro) deacylase [Lachnospiraceae bacterium]
MAKKENKTNAMRILETMKIPFETHTYECDEFIDGIQIADMLGLPHDKVFKTLVTVGASKNYFVFVIPIAEELDMKKAARSVGEKNVAMIPVKDINQVTGYIRGGCTAIGMKKQYVTRVAEEAILQDTIIVSGGKLGMQIELKPDDLLQAAGAEYADLLKE